MSNPVNIAALPMFQFNQSGAPVAGGQLFTYTAGTTTPLATYTDATGATAHANPIILDANGQASVWLKAGCSYKFVLSPSTDTNPPTSPYWTEDNIQSVSSATNLSITQFGASQASADNSVALNAMYAADLGYQNGGYIPTGAFEFSETLTISTTGNYYGAGFYSVLQPSTNFPNGSNNIHITPNPGLANFLPVFEKFTLGSTSTGTRGGFNGIFLDTDVENAIVPKFTMRDVTIFSGIETAFACINNPSSNVNGGMYCANIENNMLYGSVNIQQTGDSNCIHKNIITGNGVGIYAANVTGASLLSIENNNITSNNGAIKIDSGSRFKILRNNMEQKVPFEAGAQYMIDIAGNVGTMSMGEIRGNHLGLFSGVQNSANIHVSNALGVLISDNTILNANPGGIGIIVDSNALNTRIGPNQYSTGISAKVVDYGIGTMGVIKFPTLQSGWQAVSGNFACFYKDILGTVRLCGTITGGSGVVFVLPQGFLPAQPVRYSVYSNNGSAQVMASVFVDTAGNVIMESGSNVMLSLDGISYPAIGLADTSSNL